MAAYDPSLDPDKIPNGTWNGPLPQVQSTSTYTPPQAMYGVKGQLDGQYQGSTAADTNTTVSAVPGTGGYNSPTTAAGAQQPSFAPSVGDGNMPGMGENVSASLLGHYADAGIPQNTNYAAQQYGQFAQSTPADMSSYYNNASRNMQNTINTQMAARGSYGSSNAVGQIGNAETNLRAQQAKDEAGYGLQRAQLGGSLAGAADSSGRANSADELNWVGGISDLAFKNQREEAARYEMGNQDLLNAGNIGAGIDRSTGDAQMEADRDLMIQTLMQQGMSYSDAATAANNRVNNDRSDEKQIVDTGTKLATMVAMV